MARRQVAEARLSRFLQSWRRRLHPTDPDRASHRPPWTGRLRPWPRAVDRAAAALAELCHDPGSWRTATIETWRDQTVRVWRAIEPRSATRPLDAGIPVVPAVGTSIPAIGFCAPTSGPDQPHGPASVQAWKVDGDTVQPIALRQIEPVTGVSPYGALYGPPADVGSRSTWPIGLVVFRYEELGTQRSRWFAIEVSRMRDDPVALPSVRVLQAP